MCVEAILTEMTTQRDDTCYQLKCSKKRKSTCTSVVKAAVLKCNALCVKKRMINGKSLRRPGRRSGLIRDVMWEKRGDAARCPPGAMAPPNTTQYLMDMAYRDMSVNDQWSVELNLFPFDFSRQSDARTDGHFNPNIYSSLYTDEETMAFQHRDFENVFFQHEI